MIVLQAKAEYVDESQNLVSAVNGKKRRVLFRSGGFGRTYLRNRIRPSGSTSQPGDYPFAKRSASGIRDIRFSVNQDSCVIGHTRYSRSPRVRPVGKTVTELINEGGSAIAVIPEQNERYVSRYRARPFRDLALPDISSFFRDRMREERL